MKTSILYCAILIGAVSTRVANAGYADVILADGPVAYWQLDETDDDAPIVERTGNVANGEYLDEGGLDTDSDGAIVGEAGSSVFFSESFGFGCGGACSRGDVPVGGVLDLTEDISLEAWFRIEPSTEEVLPAAAFPRIFHYNNLDDGQYSFGVVGESNAGFEGSRYSLGQPRRRHWRHLESRHGIHIGC